MATNVRCEWVWAGYPRCERSAVGKVNGTVPICQECAERANLDRIVWYAAKWTPTEPVGQKELQGNDGDILIPNAAFKPIR